MKENRGGGGWINLEKNEFLTPKKTKTLSPKIFVMYDICENQDQFAQWLEKKIGHWNSEKNIAIKKIPTVQKCFKVVERHCLKNLSDLLKF